MEETSIVAVAAVIVAVLVVVGKVLRARSGSRSFDFGDHARDDPASMVGTGFFAGTGGSVDHRDSSRDFEGGSDARRGGDFGAGGGGDGGE